MLMFNRMAAGYEAALRDFRLEFSRAGALTAMALIVFGVGLDRALYPAHALPFAAARAVVAISILSVLLVILTDWGRQRVQWLTFVWLLMPQAMISWMIAVTEGEHSIYYVGLMLAIFASGIVLAFGLWQNLVFGAASFILYLLACWRSPSGLTFDGVFVVNALFLLMAVTVSAVYTFFNERARYLLFRLKAEVAEKNSLLEQTNRDLAQIKGQMLQQEKMAAIGTLAAGLMHEVNNPVNFCMMAIDIGIEDPAAKSSPLLTECLFDAKQGMQRVQHIVSDLKTFAYRKSDGEPQGVPFLFEKALGAAVRLMGHEMRGVQFTRALPPDTLVRGDEAAIIGVLINLLSNAVLAMRKAGRTQMAISVQAEWHGEYLQVAVQDNGHGIDPDQLTRVFEPFFTTREVGQGLGLGLSISYAVIQRHGGVLRAESEAGHWTRMVFDLVRAQ
jgi:two-component system sensor histidine kinase PhcS